MADYPNPLFDQSSAFKPESGLLPDYADDGTVRIRDQFTQTQYNISLKHSLLTSLEKDAILAHYSTHKGIKFNVVTAWGDTYFVQYMNEPEMLKRPGVYWRAKVSLRGVKL